MDDLVERLLKVESSKPDFVGVSTCWHRNPDGPEAVQRIADLETALEYSERRVVAEVVAWLRAKALKAWGADTSGMDETAFIATALETGDWKKDSPPPPTV